MHERTQAQRLASAANVAKARQARRDAAATRRSGLDAELEQSYRPALQELEAALADPRNGGRHAQKCLLELAKIAATSTFDPARSRAIKGAIEAAFGRSLSEHL